MGFPTMWFVRPAKAQPSLCICADWSESLLVAWVFYYCWATDRTSFGISKLKMRLHRIVWVYTCQNATLLEITCHGSYAVGTQNNRLIETLLLSTKTYVKTDGLENVYNFTLKVYLNLWVCFTGLLCGFKYMGEMECSYYLWMLHLLDTNPHKIYNFVHCC